MSKLNKFEDVDVFAFLNAIMKQNTGFYQSDFDIDREIIAKTAASESKEDKTLVLTRNKPPVFIKGGLHGKLVMLKSKVLLGCSVVGIFRADMFECCQPLHLLSARFQTSRRQGRKWRLGLRRTGRCTVRRIRSDTGQSD